MERLETVWQLDPSCLPESPQEVVVLTSRRVDDRLEASAVRTWVSDLEGVGLEADITDPVDILIQPTGGALPDFHAAATRELLERMKSDYEIADLFCSDEAFGLG